MQVKSKDVQQNSNNGGDQLEGGRAIGSSDNGNVGPSAGKGSGSTNGTSAGRPENKQQVEVVLKLQLEVNNVYFSNFK